MAAELHGLVLSGGASRRMGRDKGSLEYHAEPQVMHAWKLLAEVCGRAYVSTNARSAGVLPYSALPLIVDKEDYRGPAAALAAAWSAHPEAAWLVLAVDMPLVDGTLLTELIAARDPDAFATVCRGASGAIEPLCAIWEPAASEPLLRAIGRGDASPRRFLERHREAGRVALFSPSEPGKLRGINRRREHDELLEALRAPVRKPSSV